MGFRLKLGRFASIGKTGVRLHANTRHFSASTGASGTRAFARFGPLYWNWSKK